MVRISIVGAGETKPVVFPDGSATEAVEKKLVIRFGAGGLERDGVGVLSETLTGDYEYHVTSNTAGGISDERLSKLIDDHVDKRMKSIPGKQNTVFLLYKNGFPSGSAFAIEKNRILTARHNLFPLNQASDSVTSVQVKVAGDFINLEVEATPEPTVEVPVLPTFDDWIILRSTVSFRNIILVEVREDSYFVARPYITIYHYPINYHSANADNIAILSSQNRVSQVDKGLLYCNDLCNVSGGSCGGPYVDNSSGGAYGLHIEAMNRTKVFKNLIEAESLMPVALHFGPDSSIVTKLKELKVAIAQC